jgi:hypothetical protein
MRHAVLSPPVAMRFVLAGIALVVLLVASGTLKVEFWARASNRGGRLRGAPSTAEERIACWPRIGLAVGPSDASIRVKWS